MSDFGDRIDPVFPTEAPPDPPVLPMFDVYFTVRGITRVREVVGEDERDAAVAQLGELGAEDIQVVAQ